MFTSSSSPRPGSPVGYPTDNKSLPFRSSPRSSAQLRMDDERSAHDAQTDATEAILTRLAGPETASSDKWFCRAFGHDSKISDNLCAGVVSFVLTWKDLALFSTCSKAAFAMVNHVALRGMIAPGPRADDKASGCEWFAGMRLTQVHPVTMAAERELDGIIAAPGSQMHPPTAQIHLIRDGLDAFVGTAGVPVRVARAIVRMNQDGWGWQRDSKFWKLGNLKEMDELGSVVVRGLFKAAPAIAVKAICNAAWLDNLMASKSLAGIFRNEPGSVMSSMLDDLHAMIRSRPFKAFDVDRESEQAQAIAQLFEAAPDKVGKALFDAELNAIWTTISDVPRLVDALDRLFRSTPRHVGPDKILRVCTEIDASLDLTSHQKTALKDSLQRAHRHAFSRPATVPMETGGSPLIKTMRSLARRRSTGMDLRVTPPSTGRRISHDYSAK